MPPQGLSDLLRLLAGGQPDVEVGGRPGRHDRTAPAGGAQVRRHDRGPADGSLESREARLTVAGHGAGRGEHRGVRRPGPGQMTSFPVGHGVHAVIEAGDRDPAGLVVQARDERGQDLRGIGDTPPERPGVQVPGWPGNLEAAPEYTAKPGNQDRSVRREHPGVGDQCDVCGQRRPAAGHRRQQGRAADFLLTIEDQPEVDRQRRRGREPRADSGEVRHELALVIAGAAGVEIRPALGRPERVGGPRSHRFHRLNVVVPVDEHGGPPWPATPGGGDHGGDLAAVHLHVGQADPAERPGQPGGAGAHVPGASWISAHRRVATQRVQAAESGGPRGPCITDGRGHGVHDAGIACRSGGLRQARLPFCDRVRPRVPPVRATGGIGRLGNGGRPMRSPPPAGRLERSQGMTRRSSWRAATPID